jgi:hypothetical protein
VLVGPDERELSRIERIRFLVRNVDDLQRHAGAPSRAFQRRGVHVRKAQEREVTA